MKAHGLPAGTVPPKMVGFEVIEAALSAVFPQTRFSHALRPAGHERYAEQGSPTVNGY